MKHIILYTATFLMVSMASAQTIPDIIKAFKSDNSSEIISYLDNSIEITMDGQNTTYNINQAGKFLSDFFANNKVRDFKVLHKSESGGTAYCIGNLITSGGNFRVTFFTKDKGGKTLLQEIRFEK